MFTLPPEYAVSAETKVRLVIGFWASLALVVFAAKEFVGWQGLS